MIEIGLFEGERVELLDGTVVTMSPHGPAHDGAVDELNEQLQRALGDRARVRVQSAFAASNGSEPEPDLAVVPRKSYRDAHPDEAWLIIEVADSSRAKDLGVKARLYAESRVPEYWVVDLSAQAVEIHLRPANGGYELKRVARRGESIAVAHFPDIELSVDHILGS